MKAERALTVIIYTWVPAHALALAFQMHGCTMGTFTKGLVYARHWTGQLNLNVNVTNLEDTHVLPLIRLDFCGNENLKVGPS